MLKLNSCKTFKELCTRLCKEFKDNFDYDNIKLWLIDESTGVLKSYDNEQNESKIMVRKGILGEALKLEEAAFKRTEKEKYLYTTLDTGKKVSTDNTLLNPIWISNSKPLAVLEINYSKREITKDDEYFVLALSNYIK